MIERGRADEIHLNITNKSDQPVKISEIALASQAFNISRVETGTVLPLPTPGANGIVPATRVGIEKDLGPFQTFVNSLAVTANENAPFSQNKLILTLKYSWQSGEQKFESAQPVTLSIEVRRRFDEEAKGLPVGTAAILYLLLPILPALLTYQLVNARRKHEGWRVPTFGAEHIVPAFFLATLFSLFVIWRTKNHREINYSDYGVLLEVIIGSALVGAAIPTFRWVIDAIRRWIYDFKETDTGKKYLLRALRPRHRKKGFVWAKGKVGSENWEGILFQQLDGAPVLGATLQISKAEAVTDAEWKTIKKTLFGSEQVESDDDKATTKKLLDPKYLRKLVKAKKVKVGGHWKKVKVDSAFRETFVVVDAVKELKLDPATTERALVRAMD